jgi:hypothetical protein
MSDAERERKIKFLKVWYVVFATIMDAHGDGEYTDALAIGKLRGLRNALTTRLPEVEAALLERQQERSHD